MQIINNTIGWLQLINNKCSNVQFCKQQICKPASTGGLPSVDFWSSSGWISPMMASTSYDIDFWSYVQHFRQDDPPGDSIVNNNVYTRTASRLKRSSNVVNMLSSSTITVLHERLVVRDHKWLFFSRNRELLHENQHYNFHMYSLDHVKFQNSWLLLEMDLLPEFHQSVNQSV